MQVVEEKNGDFYFFSRADGPHWVLSSGDEIYAVVEYKKIYLDKYIHIRSNGQIEIQSKWGEIERIL